MGKMTDNLLKYVSANVANNAGTAGSAEIEFDIPRGYVAKIQRMRITPYNLSEDLHNLTGDFAMQVSAALVRDPDDSTNITPPNSVKHDILQYLLLDITGNDTGSTGGSIMVVNESVDTGYIPESIDVITARNLRFNIDQFGSNKSDLTASGMRAEVWFTYEKVTNTDLAELLDIL
jgi:hypothetical protein